MKTACLSFKNEGLTRSICLLLFALSGALSLVLRPAKADFFESVQSLQIKQEALRLMGFLERGDIEAYDFQIKKMPVKRIKKIVKVVNFEGDNLLHFLVRLETFDYQYDSQALVSIWQHIGAALGENRLIQTLIKKNKQGVSPAMEAAFSKSPERAKLAFSLPPKIMEELSDGLGALATRGRAYDALHRAVQFEVDTSNWRAWNIGFVSSSSAFSFLAGYYGFTFSHGPSMVASATAAAGAASVCALMFRRIFRKRALVKTQLD